EIVLNDAIKAADWIVANRALPGGGYAHGEKDSHGPYLGDTLAMGEAFSSLYGVTGNRAWLIRAESAAAFIKTNFADAPAGAPVVPGSLSDKPNPAATLKPLKKLAQNIRLARWFNRLAHYTGKAEYRELAKAAMQFAATPAYGSGDINDS